MLSNAKVKSIQQFRNTTDFTASFIQYFDEEWKKVVNKMKRSGADLKQITIKKAE